MIVVTGLLSAARYKTSHYIPSPNERIEAATPEQIATTLRTVADADNEVVQNGSSCGVESWAKKTLMLPGDAALPTTPVETSIERLRSLTPPTNIGASQRVSGVEDREWSIRAVLLGVRLERDSDYHLVLASPNNPQLTMIGEIPASYCTNSGKAAAFAVARHTVDQIAHHRADSQFIWLDRRGVQNAPVVIVSGYGFFDRVGNGHREVGGAASGIELHPVLSVQVTEP